MNLSDRRSADILESVYKNADMAYEASGDVLKACRSGRLYNEIAEQRERYKSIAADASGELFRRGRTPKGSPPYAKAAARMGIAAKTAGNRSSSNIAQIMIRGTTAGIIDMQRTLNRSRGADPHIHFDAQQLLKREQDFCDHLKTYL